MTKIIIEHIEKVDDLLLFSSAYQEGIIKVNITKLAEHLGKDRKTIRRYLKGDVPKKTKQRTKYLDQHQTYIQEVLSDK